MAGKGRPAGFLMDDSHRTKIANSQILNRLIKHAEGELELTSTQVQTGLGLLKKVLPDLQSIQHQGGGENGEIIFRTIYEGK